MLVILLENYAVDVFLKVVLVLFAYSGNAKFVAY